MKVAFQVRIPADELVEWRVKAAKMGFRSVADLVRASVTAYPEHAGAIAGASASEPPRDIDPAECPKRVQHRKGVFCKHCGATP